MKQPINPILVTGSAGFIGFHLSKRLLDEGFSVVGFDNLNEYYDSKLKIDRLTILKNNSNFTFIKGSIENLELLESLFEQYNFPIVVHLAAQAGVRYSLENPHQYIQSNLVGFTNILECCKKWKVEHLLYASSSSVYGNNKKTPFSIEDRVDHPVSIYAATKKANELMAYTYSHLYNLPATGMRFFTVYGPWGRPDMALFTFADAIINQRPIHVYNCGNMKRDFTYIDDVVESIMRLLKKGPPIDSVAPHKIYNIGNNKPEQLNRFIETLEKHLGQQTQKVMLPMQPGDVVETYADISELEKDIHYHPQVSIDEGIKRFVNWFTNYYKNKQ
ncbi:nucleoside-diphosphate-sugar epimerase [Schinkia azotoformans MEV2011]|uniref:Nucleoside-diphosphate-sugar epimerase n=1 Tax=Schinkia azotoformans MEV2011 TaxID=1348973 RepID=A0A072NSH5_SCHAZ|nr:NAD-dependent epimerase [Schinkia azotoformans]KEF36160.1 nucleoside-diphosphate-sugar epimerase [Schinkia azotoformans MEV2011]MEC1696248.1 NAD-dependent epimerase [Schinkia azotoformans]MEC1727106.1 NAD-dependent epimerase [Schinkia azotoformans]MEC1771800.1 NAD-dependent epimerase [Schinkia azotoformans]MEC1780649.1 NAD-dependent epimerase [Schinkia azotoformans]